ncbi:hypothetical protein [Mycolicibacterium sp. CH28]|uniref:hypothetical protein n=1 Tax=Mycolicibacterium sp. CH28 TaxID=2512237 RepID=UPI001F1ED7A9|nr:hypothetical protein [Mycolicibacterium sp. CH28]
MAVFALVGALIGAAVGALAAPPPSKFTASANVALLPPADLTAQEASSFWEVLTRGQVTRTAAVLYADTRWLSSAAKSAKVSPNELSLTAGALPETTMLTVTVTAPSSTAAEAALNDVLTTATPEVSALASPYDVKVLFPLEGSAVPVPVPGKAQLAAAGGIGGLLVAIGVSWVIARRRRNATVPVGVAADTVDEEPLRR